MKVKPEASSAPTPVLELVQALARYAENPDELIQMAMRLWPDLDVYQGDTHLRLMTTGNPLADSIYVELRDNYCAKDREEK
jgi:hypothetical protein